MGEYYFLASVLPAMPFSLGDKPLLAFPDVSTIIQRNIEPEDAPLAKALLMMIDVSNLETIHQERDVFIEGGTLTREEVEHKRNIPLFVRTFFDEKDRGMSRPYLFDALWEGYYKYVYSVGQEMECRFLIDYTSWNISLRNQLVALRTNEGTKEIEDYCLLTHIGGYDLSSVIVQLKSQKNPLMAERLLDEERLKHVFHCEGGDPFSVDAILAALERTRIYDRWAKMSSPFKIDDIIKGEALGKYNG
jgi:vacuolar-type H+-ATPase subunit C/Vma6